MSTQRKPEFVEEELSDEVVQDYLEAHPDFFERHSALLSTLTVPHGAGEAVSLVCADEHKHLIDIEQLLGKLIKREYEPGFEPGHEVPASPSPTRPVKPKKPKKPKKHKVAAEKDNQKAATKRTATETGKKKRRAKKPR